MRKKESVRLWWLRAFVLQAKRLRREQAGATAVEFAVIAPILIAMMIGIVDYGLGLYTDTQLANAAQAAVDYAMQKGYDAAAMTTVAQSSTRLTGITAAPSQYCGCPSATGVTSTSCDSSCSDGLTAGTYAKVVATKEYGTLLSYPGIPANIHLSETATARVQ